MLFDKSWGCVMRILLFLFSLLVAVEGVAGGFAWTPNLLENPGAESGSLVGWTTDDPEVVQASRSQRTQSGIVQPRVGDWFFNMAAGPAGPSGETVEKRLYQKVDVSAYSTAIDNSQLLARASSYFQTEDRPEFEGSDVGGVNIYFLDGQAEVIDRWRSILASPNLTWVQGRL